MPAFKLTPTEDEHLYSLVAAYLAVLGSTERRALLRQSFGPTTGRVHIMFPNRIGWFAATDLAPFDDSMRIVEKLTPYPYFQRFVTDEVRRELVNGMIGEGETRGRAIFPARLVQAAGPRHVRLCLQCAEESLFSRPVASWRRVHQLPGVVVCPDHGISLCDSQIRTDRMRELAPGPRSLLGLKPIQTGMPGPLADSLARNTAWLLRNPGPSLPAPALGEAVARMLADAGWVPARTGVQAATRDAFERMLDDVDDDETRRELGLPGRPGHRQDWIARLWEDRAETVLHPVRYLLLLAFVQRDMRDLIETAEAVTQQPKAEPAVRRSVPREDTLLRNKARFGALVAAHPDASRTALRLLNDPLYTYLVRYDPEWLEGVMPPDRRMLGLKPGRGDKDAAAAEKVVRALVTLSATDGRPERITLASIAKLARINVGLIKSNELYPLASAAAAAAVESDVIYRRRRLDWGADQLMRQRARPSWRRLRKLAVVPHSWREEDQHYTEELMRQWESAYTGDGGILDSDGNNDDQEEDDGVE